MRRFAALLGIALILGSCSPTKRAQRLLERAYRLDPKLGDSSVVVVMDTVVLPGDTIDREFVTNTRDTIEVFKDRIRIKLIRDFDALQVFGECPTDTIYREVAVKCPPRVVVDPKWYHGWQWAWVGLVLALLIGFYMRK